MKKAAPEGTQEALCAPLLSCTGARREIKSRFRSAISPGLIAVRGSTLFATIWRSAALPFCGIVTLSIAVWLHRSSIQGPTPLASNKTSSSSTARSRCRTSAA
jgi:hypothetical protein